MAFKARPVVGGHFAFLALERACGGEAVASLSFLDDEPAREFNMEKFGYGGAEEGERPEL